MYGPESHRLSFGQAVERGLLSDYKVLVLTVDQDMIADTVQQGMAGEFGELRFDDASKIVGCWNGLAKRAGTTPTGTGFAPGEAPMRRAVAFAKDIKASKQVRDLFPPVVDGYRSLLEDARDDGRAVDDSNLDLACEVHHVDGTFNALERGRELAWLKAPAAEDECRILTNARCLHGSAAGLFDVGMIGPTDGQNDLSAFRSGFITHLHSDHVTDLATLLVQGFVGGGLGSMDAPLQVYGPGAVGNSRTFSRRPGPPPTRSTPRSPPPARNRWSGNCSVRLPPTSTTASSMQGLHLSAMSYRRTTSPYPTEWPRTSPAHRRR